MLAVGDIEMPHLGLEELGFDAWFRERRGKEFELGVARVTAVDRTGYLVRNEAGEVHAEATGRLLYTAESSVELPCVGDWVHVEYHDEGTLAVIHARFPRKTVLKRKAAGRKIDYQLIAANIDTAFIVQSCELDFNLRRLDRYLAMVNEGGIEPVIVLSKTDLVSQKEVDAMASEIQRSRIANEVLALSSLTESGLDRFQARLQKGRTYCLVGSSGVGKTTLLNHLLGRPVFETRPVRQKDGRGRHATTRRQLTVLDSGAMVIDNPGMRELGVIAMSDGLETGFSDILELAARCRFADCTHSGEAECAIRAAIDAGELGEERLGAYLKLMRESEHHERSYLERRRKDREFGRHVKSVMKHKKQQRDA